MLKKDHWLFDYCKPYFKNTAEAYAILKKKRAFICSLEEHGRRNCLSFSGGNTWKKRLIVEQKSL